ncbi:MAG: matrixin family metalloprotease, partial [Candidatus Binatia bacterium]
MLLEDEQGHPLHWDPADMPVPFRMVAGNVPGGAAGEREVQRAFATWSKTSTNLEYAFTGFDGEGLSDQDGENVVLWYYASWPHDPRAVGISVHYFDSRSGRILESDVRFNAEHHSWSIGGEGFDVQNAAAHEAGHVGGLGHTAVQEATMSADIAPGET